MFAVEFTCEVIWSWIFITYEILIVESFSFLVNGSLIFFLLSWFSLGRLRFSGFIHFVLELSILSAYHCSVVKLYLFYFCNINCNSLDFWFYLFGSSLMMSPSKGLTILFIFSKNHLVVSLTFFLFLISVSFLLLFFLLCVPCSLQELSSPTEIKPVPPCSGSTESLTTGPPRGFLYHLFLFWLYCFFS